MGSRVGVGQVADWVEFVVLSGTAPFKRGDLKSAIGQEDLAAAETMEQLTWSELERRAELFGQRWPLRLVGRRISRRAPSPVPLDLYRFFCLFGIGSVDPEDQTLFEVAVAELVRPLSGRTGLHVGAPASAGMDPSFRERIALYAATAGLLPDEVKAAPLPHDKDLGLDVVSWVSFSDRRGADLHLLVQCATGANWESKLHDINLEVWKDHIHWAVAPVRVFAVPYVLTMPRAKWVRTARRGGLILDRPRLVELAALGRLSDEVTKTMRRRVQVLRAA